MVGPFDKDEGEPAAQGAAQPLGARGAVSQVAKGGAAGGGRRRQRADGGGAPACRGTGSDTVRPAGPACRINTTAGSSRVRRQKILS
ncbi:hypothetical protein VCH24_65130 [Variovorax boronicumulans]|nr:hypothetical protein VCH24_65130 [Variovorax boronicumulans]